MSDRISKEFRVPAITRGYMDGLDPALEEYDARFSPSMENIRVGRGLFETRLGQSSWESLLSTGDVRLLDVVYLADGTRMRVAVRGSGANGVFQDYEEGTDSVFQLVTSGSGLGGTTHARFQGVVLNDLYYFTDRAGALRKYDGSTSPGTIATVSRPTAPSAGAVGRSVKHDYLSRGGRTYTESDDTEFRDNVFTPGGGGATIDDPPLGVNFNHFEIVASAPKNETISANVNDDISSNTIAFWCAALNSHKAAVRFGVGVTSPDEYQLMIDLPDVQTWTPQFLDVGGLTEINYLEFKCLTDTDAGDHLVSTIVLPGRLQGQYRYIYTHWNRTTDLESEPSVVSNSGSPIDVSAIGVTNDTTTSAAFNKAIALTFTSDDSGSTTDAIRVYRNGGVPSLTKNERGIDVWLRVGDLFDYATTLDGAVSANDTTITVDDTYPGAPATQAGGEQILVINKGGTTEEYVRYVSGSLTLTITALEPTSGGGLKYAHSDAETVQAAFLDNVSNGAIDVTTKIDRERDDPPSASRYVARAPDGRLWLFNYSGKPTGIAVSNRPTPDYPLDYEVFPDDVDPVTRRSLTQGWRFEIGGDVNDEEIVWGGLFRDQMFAFTKRTLYAINAFSQLDWGPSAVQPLIKVGCIEGDTVQVVNGVLYWVAPGPQVMRWDGSGPPQVVSYPRIAELLSNAPTAQWGNWFAVSHSKRDGHYYCLYMTPSGETKNTLRLDYNTSSDVWEPQRYKFGSKSHEWQEAMVLDGATDVQELYQADDRGDVYQAETGDDDNGTAIAVVFHTKKFPLPMLSLLHQLYLRLEGVSDTLSLSVVTGGSEYSEVTNTYSISVAGTDDLEVKQRLHRDMKGRWFQLQFTGDVSNRPALREIVVWHQDIRMGRQSA